MIKKKKNCFPWKIFAQDGHVGDAKDLLQPLIFICVSRMFTILQLVHCVLFFFLNVQNTRYPLCIVAL